MRNMHGERILKGLPPADTALGGVERNKGGVKGKKRGGGTVSEQIGRGQTNKSGAGRNGEKYLVRLGYTTSNGVYQASSVAWRDLGRGRE